AVDERRDHVDAAWCAARPVRVATGAAHIREHLTLERRGHEIRLRVAPIDADNTADADHAHGRNALFAASSESVSRSATPAWPTSGCASNARKTRSRPP